MMISLSRLLFKVQTVLIMLSIAVRSCRRFVSLVMVSGREIVSKFVSPVHDAM